MKRKLSTGFMVIYWTVLPFAAVLMTGLGWVLLDPRVSQSADMAGPLWISFGGSMVLTLLIVWRLWTHDRARRQANERISAKEAQRTIHD